MYTFEIICMYACIYEYLYMNICISICICIHKYTYLCVHLFICIHIHTYLYICIFISKYVNMCVNICVYAFVYINKYPPIIRNFVSMSVPLSGKDKQNQRRSPVMLVQVLVRVLAAAQTLVQNLQTGVIAMKCIIVINILIRRRGTAA